VTLSDVDVFLAYDGFTIINAGSSPSATANVAAAAFIASNWNHGRSRPDRRRVP
jgi:hypothetical protein